MKERPILFKGEMIRAILEGRKTQTRRVVKPQPDSVRKSVFVESGYETIHGYEIKCPYGQVGDRLWVRETFNSDWCDHVIYKADGGSAIDAGYKTEPKWKPSIHMKRQYSRINLEITDIRIERLQDITEKDSQDEGVSLLNLGDLGIETNKSAFRSLWDNINASMGYGWSKNPWVWVVEFRKVN